MRSEKTWISAHWVRMWVLRIWQERKFCSWLDLVCYQYYYYSFILYVSEYFAYMYVYVCMCIYMLVCIYILYIIYIYNIYTAYTYQQYLMHNGVCTAYISCAHRRGNEFPGTGVTSSCESPRGCWKLNWSPLEEQ